MDFREMYFLNNGLFVLNLGKLAPPVNQPLCPVRQPAGLEKFHCTKLKSRKNIKNC